MNFVNVSPSDYQIAIAHIAMSYSVYNTKYDLPTYMSGLTEEIGELSGALHDFFENKATSDKYKEEFGDVLAYFTLAINKFGLSLDDIIKKSSERPQGQGNLLTIFEKNSAANGLVKRLYRGDFIPNFDVQFHTKMGELLDCLMAFAVKFDIQLEEVMILNIRKLGKRVKNNTIMGSGDR